MNIIITNLQRMVYDVIVALKSYLVVYTLIILQDIYCSCVTIGFVVNMWHMLTRRKQEKHHPIMTHLIMRFTVNSAFFCFYITVCLQKFVMIYTLRIL